GGVARRLHALLTDAAAARSSDVVFEQGQDACKVFCIVNDRKLPLCAPLTPEEGRQAMGFLFHCKDEGSSQTSYRRASFQGFSIRAGGAVPLPGGISALRCERGPHDPDADHLFARLFYTDRLDAGTTLERLGFSHEEAALFAEIRMAMQGGVFIGGRAGDGKSTTLAVNLALQMSEMAGQLNLVTLEDPVEYRIPGAIQIAVPTAGAGETRAGHFKEALMHFCRVHPASGMVSEIRDADAARQVLQCVDTGHQIWTTIHVHNANAIPFRLIDMGVGAAEVAKPGNVALLMKQTLLPKLCPSCALDRPDGGRAVPDGLVSRLGGLDGLRFRNADGCSECRREDGGEVWARAWNGYLGQTAIAETIRPDAGYLGFVRAGDPLGAWAYWRSEMGGVPIGVRIRALVKDGAVDPFDALLKGGAGEHEAQADPVGGGAPS
ncbi:MAG: ATPase, T2SS/T4P/T4SS family, partial [Rhodospirillales bacterium]|nr:ATPase, T2SS/T4P/T4SS family [Rhodospirillales bacterium]